MILAEKALLAKAIGVLYGQLGFQLVRRLERATLKEI